MRPPLGECANAASAIDLAGIAHIDRAHLNPERRRRRLDGTPLANPGGYGGISNNGCSCHARRDLFEQLQPFRALSLARPISAPFGEFASLNSILSCTE